MWIVVIEARGVKPSSTYYSRRDKLGLRVRQAGDKNTSVAERVEKLPGLIVQEGCVITPSESQALAVAALALDEGLHDVFVGKLPDLTPVENWDYDLGRITQHLADTLGARGRKPPEQPFSVTCLECLTTDTQIVPYPVQCEKCGSLNFKSRAGHAPIVPLFDVPRGEILDYWLATRFATGWFEIPEVCSPHRAVDFAVEEICQPADLANLAFSDPKEKQAIETFLEGSDLLAWLNYEKTRPDSWLPEEGAAKLLDAAFVTRAFRGQEARKAARFDMIVNVGVDARIALPLLEGSKAGITDIALYTDNVSQARYATAHKEYQETRG